MSNPGKISRHKSNPAYKKTFISMKIAPNEMSEIFKVLLDQDYCNPLSDDFDFKIFTEKAAEIAADLGYHLEASKSLPYFDFFSFLHRYHTEIVEKIKEIFVSLDAPNQDIFLGLLEILNYDFLKITQGAAQNPGKTIRRYNLDAGDQMQTFFGETVDRGSAIDTGIDSVNIAIGFLYKYNANTNRKVEEKERDTILNSSRRLLTYASLWFVINDLLEAYKYKFIELNVSGTHADFTPFPKPYHLFLYAGKERYRSHILEPFFRIKSGISPKILQAHATIYKGELTITAGHKRIDNQMAWFNYGVILNYFFHLNQVKLKKLENITINELYLIVTTLQFAFGELIKLGGDDDNIPVRIAKENLLSYLNKSTNLSKSLIKKCLEILSTHFTGTINLWNTALVSFGNDYYFFLSPLVGSQVIVLMQRLIDEAFTKKQQLEKFNNLVETELGDTQFEFRKITTKEIKTAVPPNVCIYQTGSKFVVIGTFLYEVLLEPVEYYSTLVDVGVVAGKVNQFALSVLPELTGISEHDDVEIVKIIVTNLPLLSGINIEECTVMDLTLVKNYLSKGYYEQSQVVLGNGAIQTSTFVKYNYYNNQEEFSNRFKHFTLHPDPVEEVLRRFKFEQRQLLEGFMKYKLTTTAPVELEDAELSLVFINRIEHYLRLFYYFGNTLDKEENMAEKEIAESRITFLLPQTFSIIALENSDRYIRLELIRVFENAGLSALGFLLYLADALAGKISSKNTIPSPDLPEVILDDESVKANLNYVLEVLHQNQPVTMSQFSGKFDLDEAHILQIVDLLVFQLGQYHQKHSTLEEFDELLTNTTLLALITRGKFQYNHFVLKAFLNLIDALNFNQYYQKARDVAEEILEYCFKNHSTPIIGWLCLLKCYVKQKNINEAFVYANLALSILETDPEPDESLYVETYYEVMILFRELDMIKSVKKIFNILEKRTTGDYARQKLHLSYYNAFLKNPEKLKPVLPEIWKYLNDNTEGILKYGQASAIPWVGFILNLNNIIRKGLVKDENNWSDLAEKMSREIDSASLDHIQLLFGENHEKSTVSYKSLLQRIFETRSYDDLTKEVQNIALVSHRIVEDAIVKKDFEMVLLYGLVTNDQNLTFREVSSPEKSQISEAVQTELTQRVNDYISFVKTNLKLKESQKLLWIFSVHENTYLLELLPENDFIITNISSWDRTKMEIWIAALSGFHFPDMPEYFITEQEHAYILLLRELFPFRLDLTGNFEEILLYTDLQIGKFPFNLISANKDVINKNNQLHEEVVKEEIVKSGYDFISFHKPITNVISLEWFIENCQEILTPAESFTVEAWSPVEDKDLTLEITWDSLAPLLQETYGAKVNTERVPSVPLSGEINMFLAHGGKDLEGFKTIYTKEKDGHAILKDKGMEKVIGNGTIAVLFVCNSAYISKRLFAERLLSFTQHVLSLGYKAVVAPAWSLNPEIVTPWTKIFLREMKKGTQLSFAVQAANVGISKEGYRDYIGFYDPTGWAGMHIYGNPDISFATESKAE